MIPAAPVPQVCRPVAPRTRAGLVAEFAAGWALQPILSVLSVLMALFVLVAASSNAVALSGAEARTATANAWRRDPGAFAYHLSRVKAPPTPGGQKWEHYDHSRLLARKFRQAATTPGSRQIWCIPPRYGKSLTGSTWGPAWFLDLWPHKRVGVVSYAAELANLFGRDVRNIIDTYRGDIRVTLRQDSTAAHRWNTPNGGGMLTAGIDGTVTGFGFDLLVIDDPFKNWQEAQSETTRETVWNGWQSTFKTRLEPGGSVIVIMTRWHQDDLVGRLLQADKDAIEAGEQPEGWELVRLPAIAEEAAEYPHPVTGVPYEDPLGRKPGEVLCPRRFGLEEVMKTKATTLAPIWNGLYQQRPAAAEGTVFKREWWQWFTARPSLRKFDFFLTSWDMTFKDTAGTDYVVGQLWGRIGADRYLLDQVRGRYDFVATERIFREFIAKHPYARLHLIEDKANGPAIISRLRKRIPGLVAVNPQGSKLARAQAAAPEAEAGNVWLPTYASFALDFVEELANFPTGTHDDMVDAFSQAIDRIAKTPQQEEDEAQDQYQDLRGQGRR